jgi:hypothetical protein
VNDLSEVIELVQGCLRSRIPAVSLLEMALWAIDRNLKFLKLPKIKQHGVPWKPVLECEEQA